MIGRFLPDLLIGRDIVVHRDVERIGVIILVRHAGNQPVALFVHAYKTAGKTLRRGGQQAVVHMGAFAARIQIPAHVLDDGKAFFLHCVALAVVVSVQRDQRLGQADEADAQCSVLEYLAHLVAGAQLFAVQPDTLAHQEREVVYALFALDGETVVQLADDKLHHILELFIEQRFIAVALNGQARKVDGGEAEIAAAVGDLL